MRRAILRYASSIATTRTSTNKRPVLLRMAFDKAKFEDLLKRRFFYDQSFSIYSGIGGLYDYGPMGCATKTNIVQAWRKHFILNEAMLEVECTALTPEPVLKASGHVERFIDWMVKDVVTGECFRADHLIKNQAEALMQDKNTKPEVKESLEKVLQQLDGFSDAQMEEVIRKFDFKSPATKNDLSAPVSFNLMFPTQIGPVSDHRAYLRPETAQGIFVNFKRLLEFNQGKLPFAAAQIGSAFRNEISPRQGLIRVREFTLAEIEHFVDPADKTHPKFKNVANVELNLFSACDQRDGKSPTRVRIGEAVAKGIVNSETLGYYMARTHLYLLSVGVDAQRLRFRQHLSNEMAHYAQDCWDAECQTSYGWIECVGHADRACYDLDQHSKATGEKLIAERLLDKARVANVVEAAPNKAVIGKRFKSEGKKIISHLEKMGEEQVLKLEEMLQQLSELDICVDGNTFKLDKGMVEIKRYEKTIHIEEIHPSVIEPSFGIGRIMYVVLEHSFRQREADEKRNFLDLPPSIAPIKCAVLPLSQDKRFDPILEAVQEQLISHGMSQKTDTTGSSIGRRYARNDEIGIPFDITVDFDSLNEPWTVTLRHASSLQQVRLNVDQVGSTVSELVNGRCTWPDVAQKLPVFERNDQD